MLGYRHAAITSNEPNMRTRLPNLLETQPLQRTDDIGARSASWQLHKWIRTGSARKCNLIFLGP